MRQKLDDGIVGEITRLQNLKKDYELVKKDAEVELNSMIEYKNNPNEEIVKKAIEGEERARSVVVYYEDMISKVEKEINNLTKARNN